MRIRTRYTLFKVIIVLAVLTFALSLYDIFANQSDLFAYVMVAYIALAVFALILYLGHKPSLDEAPAVVEEPPVAVPPQDIVEEVVPEVPPPSPRQLRVQGPHNFRCPFCANVFALELTHLQKKHELRMDCPYCANTIRIPRQPKLSPGEPVNTFGVEAREQAAFECTNCGEELRYTAPGQIAGDNARVYTCPHCGSAQVGPVSGAVV